MLRLNPFRPLLLPIIEPRPHELPHIGEGAFNGALTSRLGVATVDVTRPLPFLDAEPLSVREIFAELYKSLRGGGDKDKSPTV